MGGKEARNVCVYFGTHEILLETDGLRRKQQTDEKTQQNIQCTLLKENKKKYCNKVEFDKV